MLALYGLDVVLGHLSVAMTAVRTCVEGAEVRLDDLFWSDCDGVGRCVGDVALAIVAVAGDPAGVALAFDAFAALVPPVCRSVVDRRRARSRTLCGAGSRVDPREDVG